MKFIILAVILFFGCDNSRIVNYLSSSLIPLEKTDGIYSDTTGPACDIQIASTVDFTFTADSSKLIIDKPTETMVFKFLSFDDNLDNREFNLQGYSIQEFGDYKLIYLNVSYSLSDVIICLPENRRYSFNIKSVFSPSLQKGKYHFVVNVNESWFRGYKSYFLKGNFEIN